MFNIFKKKENTPSVENDSITVNLLKLYEDLSNDVTELYGELESPNPAELRFFTMSATSVFVQALGGLPESEMHSLINKFTEQCVANMLFYMPRGEYSQVHNAFIARFGDYPHLIINVHNTQTERELQDSTFALVTVMDAHFDVDREAIDVAIFGLALSALLTDFAINVRNALISLA